MQKLILCILLLPLTAIAQQIYLTENSTVITEKAHIVSVQLRQMNEVMISSNKADLVSTKTQARQFLDDCMPSLDNLRYMKTLEVTRKGENEQWHFSCARAKSLDRSTDSQYIAVFNSDQQLVDFQSLRAEIVPDQLPSLDLKEGAALIATVTASTLASGALAHYVYPGQSDKLKHAMVGSVGGSVGAIMAYYAFGMSKDKSLAVGVITGFILGILKEMNDDHHRDKHTVDMQDAIATGMGGSVGAVLLRIKFEF